MNNTAINSAVLKQIASHHRSLGVKGWVTGLPYERCAELSWIIDYLKPRFQEGLRYLDIGSGESPLPTFLSAHSRWEITCLDKCAWVRKQYRFSARTHSTDRPASRFRVIEASETRLARGFHMVEHTNGLRWTDGDATLPMELIEGFEGATELVLQLGCSTKYPAFARAMALEAT